MHWNQNTEVQHVNIVLDSHLQLGERVHLHHCTPWTDGEESVGSHIGHEGRGDRERAARNETKADRKERGEEEAKGRREGGKEGGREEMVSY